VGDQVGVAVSGKLLYVPYKEFERICSLSVSAVEKTTLFAALCRINTLYMIARAGSGHIGSSFSSLDIMSWLQLNELRTAAPCDTNSTNDIFFSSKGHDAPGLYSTWLGLGKLNFDLIHQLRRLHGLPGHPDVSTPNVVTNTGSLGMGVSKAKGMILANRLQKKAANVYVLTGDGELQEGQFWESLISAANNSLHELTVIIDHNKLQSDTLISKVSDLGDIEAKLVAFGWHVSRCDGNDMIAISKTLRKCKAIINRPKIIIADTVKGKGVSFMEHTSLDSDVEFYKFHSGAPTEDAYVKATRELIEAANKLLGSAKANSLEVEEVIRSVSINNEKTQRLIPAYSKALIEESRKNSKIVAMDADLVIDTGLVSFKKEFPDRFIECGIAEQDMVSQAGGISLMGMIPIVHSFSCFLSARPNEQIYNNSTEYTKIIYIGSLAGLLPGGPGHSHQSVRDISALAAIPNLTMIEPCCEEEVKQALDWAVNKNEYSSYIRLVSIPWEIQYDLPKNYKMKIGCGVELINGNKIAIFAYGPIMLTMAVKIAEEIFDEYKTKIKIINMPWLNVIDDDWFKKVTDEVNIIISIDNHYKIGGQYDRINDAIMRNKMQGKRTVSVAVNKIPYSGTNDEILNAHELDKKSIKQIVIENIRFKEFNA
jgi:transketolase